MKPTVMITGASGGIGHATAHVFAKADYNLILTCHTATYELDQLAKELTSTYDISVFTYSLDLSSPQEITDLFLQLSHMTPSVTIDVLINNAGMSHIGLFTQLSTNEMMQILNTNLTSAMLCSQAVLPSMIRRQAGHIINISSIWGCTGASMEVVYSTSKAGLNGFTRALAKEVAPSNIQVNAVACGMIDTSMNNCFTEEERNLILEEIPANRMGTPIEVATYLLQLANSPLYLTGQVIGFDGGWM